MTYPTSYCFTASDLYETFNKKLVKVRQDVYEKKYGVNKKQKLCASVLCYCFSLILLDIIKNNVTFVLPLFNGKEASIFVKPYTGDEFIEAKKRGAFQGIDFITTNFTGYQIVYS